MHLTLQSTNSRSHYSAHFALAVVVKPWSCLSKDSSEKTTVLYFDSSRERTPLASASLIARAVIELNAIRTNESVDTGFAEEVERRIAFIQVKASQLSNTSASSGDVNASALQVQQQKPGSVDCGLHAIHNLRILFEKWIPNVAGIVSAIACKATANANFPCFFVESLRDAVTTCLRTSWMLTHSGTRWGSGCC